MEGMRAYYLGINIGPKLTGFLIADTSDAAGLMRVKPETDS